MFLFLRRKQNGDKNLSFSFLLTNEDSVNKKGIVPVHESGQVESSKHSLSSALLCYKTGNVGICNSDKDRTMAGLDI